MVYLPTISEIDRKNQRNSCRVNIPYMDPIDISRPRYLIQSIMVGIHFVSSFYESNILTSLSKMGLSQGKWWYPWDATLAV